MSTALAIANAAPKRAQHPLFTPLWSIQALLPQLPLLFPVETNLGPSPKTRYRSHYHYPGPHTLLDSDRRRLRSDFEIALYLIDFSPLQPLLAEHYVPQFKGADPFPSSVHVPRPVPASRAQPQLAGLG